MSCVFPNGTRAVNDTPCNAGLQFSACCPRDSVCLDNGYCFSGFVGSEGKRYQNLLFRASCTDATFQNPNCPQKCLEQGNYTYEVLVPFLSDPSSTSSAAYCCGFYNITSNSCLGEADSVGSLLPFQIPNGVVITNRTSGTSQNIYGYSNTVVTPTASPATQSPSAKSSSNAAAIGAGVAVPLGVLLIAAIVALWFQHWRHRKQIVGKDEQYEDVKQQLVHYQTSAELEHSPRHEIHSLPIPLAELEGRSRQPGYKR